jgi:hypothetical protein
VQTGVRLVIADDTGTRKDELFFALLLLLNIRTRTPCFIDGAEYLASNRRKRLITVAVALSAGESMGQHTKERGGHTMTVNSYTSG